MTSSDSFVTAASSPYQIYDKVAQDAVRDAIVQAVGTAVVYWVAGFWRPLAIAAFVVFGIVTLLEAIQVIGLTGAGLFVLVAGKREESLPADSKWLWAANVVRVGSLALSCYLLTLLFHRLWP